MNNWKIEMRKSYQWERERRLRRTRMVVMILMTLIYYYIHFSNIH